MTDNKSNLTDKEVTVISNLAKEGRLPLKLVTGKQITSPQILMPGAVHAEEGATIIFVCG